MEVRFRVGYFHFKKGYIFELDEWSGHTHLSQKVYLILILLKDYLTRSAFQAINKAKRTKQQLLRKLMCPTYMLLYSDEKQTNKPLPSHVSWMLSIKEELFSHVKKKGIYGTPLLYLCTY